MNDFNGINVFGSLTSKTSGLKITYKDLKAFDTNNDGLINNKEFNNALKELDLDIVTFRTIDDNGDKSISRDEFDIWEQKSLMQDCVNEKLKVVYNNAALQPYLNEFNAGLKDFMLDFISNYKNEVYSMASKFKSELDAKFNQIKYSKATDETKLIKTSVLQNIGQSLKSERDSNGNIISEDVILEIIDNLEKEADRFIKTYGGDYLNVDLQTYLNNYLNTSDKENLAGSIQIYQTSLQSIDSTDLKQVQSVAREFLESVVQKGIIIRIGNINVASQPAVTSAIAQFKSTQELTDALNYAIQNIKTTPRKQELIENTLLKIEQQKMKNVASIKGREYQISGSTIDWSKVSAGYSNEEEIHERGKGWSGSRDKAYESGLAILNSDGLKSQIKTKIETMLKSKDISEDIYRNIINNIFENVYNQSVQDTLNAENMITGRGARGLSSRGHAYIKIKALCDTFIDKFNANVVKYIDAMNASYTDFDTIDLDFSNLNSDEYGHEIKDGNGETIKDNSSNAGDIAKSYATGVAMTTRKHGADYYFSIAEEILDGLKPQILKKAQTMCRANGIKFDTSIFNNIFNNAKELAKNEAITGSSAKPLNALNIISPQIGLSAGLFGIAGVSSLTSGLSLGTTLTAALTGPVGWAAMGIGGIVGGLLGGLFGSKSSECTMNTKLLVDEFTAQFKTNYTKWVDEEKTKSI